MSKVVYRKGTQGTETSKYLQEKKENSIPKVMASEIGRAQTNVACNIGVRTTKSTNWLKKNCLGRQTKEGESPVI